MIIIGKYKRKGYQTMPRNSICNKRTNLNSFKKSFEGEKNIVKKPCPPFLKAVSVKVDAVDRVIFAVTIIQ